MDTDFDIYIKLVGIQKVKNDLKASLSEANAKEEWNLIHDITDFLQSNINKNNHTFNQINNKDIDQKDIEFTKNNQLSKITNCEIFEKCKIIIVEQLELSSDEEITPESIIFRRYGETNYNSTNLNNSVTDYSSVRYKYKDHWFVGLAQGLSALASTGVGDSTMKCDYYSDLGCDDLDFVELIMAVEEEFDIEISDETAEHIKTVQNLCDIVIYRLEE